MHAPGALAAAVVALVVVGFSRGWVGGSLVLDGPGTAMFVRVALDHLHRDHRIGYWWPELWTGTPVWALAPVFPLLLLLPAAALLGADAGTRLMTVVLQAAGGIGALVLARSLLDRRPGGRQAGSGSAGVAPGNRPAGGGAAGLAAGIVAGVVYGLSPMAIGVGVVSGAETSLVVIAVTPWLVWALRRGLRGDGAGWLIAGAGLGAATLLAQAEHAFGLAVLAAALVVAQARRPGVRGAVVIGRALAIGAISAGLAAFWLVPFAGLHDRFVLTPPVAVAQTLTNPVAGGLAHQPDSYLSRGGSLHGAVTFATATVRFDHVGRTRIGTFYLGWVAAMLSLVAAGLLVRRPEEDGTRAGVLVASVLCLWISSGAVPLAHTSLADRSPLTWIGAALAVGAVGAAWLRSLRVGPATTRVVGVTLAAAAVLAPWTAPFLALRRVLPLLDAIRFPRFYPVAILGVSLGAAYVAGALARVAGRAVVMATGSLRGTGAPRWRVLEVLAAAATASVLVGVVIVDVHPYAADYHLRGSAPTTATVAAVRQRVASGRAATDFSGPEPLASLVGAGVPVAVGWPTAIAIKDAWRLTGEPQFTPAGYAQAALELSGSTAVAVATSVPAPGLIHDGASPGLAVLALDHAEPITTASGAAVSVADPAVATELAVELWRRHLGPVVAASSADAREVGGRPSVTGPAGGGAGGNPVIAGVGAHACSDVGGAVHATDAFPGGAPAVAALVATACSLHPWLGVAAQLDAVPLSTGVAVMVSPLIDGLSSVDLWLLDGAASMLTVHAGAVNGAALATVTAAGVDEDGLTRFAIPAGTISRGQRVVVSVSCPACPGKPALVVQRTPRSPGAAVITGGPGSGRPASGGRGAAGGGVAPERTAGGDVSAKSTGGGSAALALHYAAGADRGLSGPNAVSGPGPAIPVSGSRTGLAAWRVEVDTPGPSVVRVASSFFPGWAARVDGRRVAIREADGAFLAVAVPAGHHVVRLAWRPPASVAVGRLLSGVTLLAVILALMAGRRPIGEMARARRPRRRHAGHQPWARMKPYPPREDRHDE